MDENWGQGSVNNDIGWGQGAINNDINWGYSHFNSSSGDTNITGQGSVPATERYSVSDCVGILGLPNVHTMEYPQGTYQLNERVWYEFNGWPTFGYILEIGVAATDEAYIDGNTNIISSDCLDNTINLNAYNSYDGGNFYFSVELQSLDDDFISTNSEYTMYVDYYNYAVVTITINGEQDDRSFSVSGSQELTNYNFDQGGEYEIIGESQTFACDEIITYSEQVIYMNVGFDNINMYTNNDCDNRYFLRFGSQFGNTFYADYRNDNC